MKIASIAVSKKKGTRKHCVEEALLVKDYGIKGDAHAGKWHRQVSFLATESIDRSKNTGLDVTFGDFAENIATTGIEWKQVPVGTRFRFGKEVLVEITQIGKECKNKCAKVLEGGIIHCGDEIKVLK
jgi:MOSC domain-containing protein YiiM